MRHISRTSGETLSSFVEKLAGVPLQQMPGDPWMYSYATDVCGHLVEALSGQSPDRYFEENIFEPLGMRDAAFHMAPDKVDRFSANYQRPADKTLKRIDGPYEITYLLQLTFLSGGGGLRRAGSCSKSPNSPCWTWNPLTCRTR